MIFQDFSLPLLPLPKPATAKAGEMTMYAFLGVLIEIEKMEVFYV